MNLVLYNNDNLLDFIKNKLTNTNYQIFIESFYVYLNYPKDEFIINLADIYKWLGYSDKSRCKRKFISCKFLENKDYILSTKQNFCSPDREKTLRWQTI